MVDALAEMVAKQRGAMMALAEVSEKLGTASEEFAAVAEEQAASSEEIASAVRHIASKAGESASSASAERGRMSGCTQTSGRRAL
jgi:methyl-accepting chemotaxis protein